MSVIAEDGLWTCPSDAASIEFALARQAPEAPAFVDADGTTTF